MGEFVFECVLKVIGKFICNCVSLEDDTNSGDSPRSFSCVCLFLKMSRVLSNWSLNGR